MRTAVVRVDIDPAGQLDPGRLAAGTAALRTALAGLPPERLGMSGAPAAEVLAADLAGRPAGRREVQVLVTTADAGAALAAVLDACAAAFGTEPAPGVLTFVSRGTDDDAHGVLAGLGLRGEIVRVPDADGFDVVHVTLDRADLERVPESRVHTALEASLNCEVRIGIR